MHLKRFALSVGLLCTACDDRTKLVPAYSWGADCTAGTFTLTRADPSVMFVLDRSGSMSTAFGTGTRWSTMTTSLQAVLPSAASDLELGAYFFPSSGAANLQCVVPGAAALTPAVGQVDALLSLMSSTNPAGATPTAEAIDAAAEALQSYASTGKSLALVLATDGAPNCNSALSLSSCTCLETQCASSTQCLDDTRTTARVANWAAQGISTWVIGVAANSTFSAVLDALALAGGRPNTGSHSYYSASSATELTQAFATIQSQLRSCTFITPSVPSSGGSLTLTLNGATVPYDASGLAGWRWGSATNSEIVLRGAACEQAMSATVVNVVATVTCSAEDAGATNESVAAFSEELGLHGPTVQRRHPRTFAVGESEAR